MIKNRFSALLLAAIPFLSSCDAIGGIFKAGMWWAFILMIAVVGLIVWIVSKARK